MSADLSPESPNPVPTPDPNRKPDDDPSLQVSPDLQFQEVPPDPQPAPPASTAVTPQQPPSPQFQPPVSLPANGAARPVVLGGKPKRSKAPLVILIVLLLLGAGAGAYLYWTGKNAKSQSTGSVTIKPDLQPKKVIKTNSWTGKANNFNWGDTANWSLGTPANGQNLEIDMANVAQPKDATGTLSFVFQNNLANLTVNKLTIKGNVDAMLADIKGQPLSVAAGIDFMVTQTKTDLAIPQLQFDIPVTFTGDQTIHATGRNMLSFTAPTEDQALDIGDKSISFVSSDDSQIVVSDMLKGSGTVIFPKASTATKWGASFTRDSPDFTGKVRIESGNRVSVLKSNPQAGTQSLVMNPFGKAGIEVQDGATLSLNASGARALTLPNDMTLSGKGLASATKNAGDYDGVVSACLSKGQGQCDLDTSVTLSGKITLAANSQLGASFGEQTTTKPSTTTVSYTLPQLTKGTFTLTAVDGSKVVIK